MSLALISPTGIYLPEVVGMDADTIIYTILVQQSKLAQYLVLKALLLSTPYRCYIYLSM